MSSIRRCLLADDALLRKYVDGPDGASPCYTDCYVTDVDGSHTLPDFVLAFYTTWLFRLERAVLGTLAGRPSTDAEAAGLAHGDTDTFAAWHVEERSASQLLLCDFRGRTRSWLMVEARPPAARPATRLYFGSAVVPVESAPTGRGGLGFVFRIVLPLHKLYSRALLHLARSAMLRR